MLKLQFLGSQKPSIWLVSASLKIGQDKSCDIVIDEEGVAGEQAELINETDNLKLKVLESGTKPTRVNGLILIDEIALKLNDTISIGKTEFKIIDPLSEKFSEAAASTSEESKDRDEANHTTVRASNVRWMLRALSPPFKGQLFPIKEITKVGRDNSSDVPIPISHVSRKHAELILNDDTLVVKDLNSRNGTYVNGKKVSKQVLKHGDEIRIDIIAFKVLGPHEEEPVKRDPNATVVRPMPKQDDEEKDSEPKPTKPRKKKAPVILDPNAPASRKAYLHALSGPVEDALIELDKKQNHVGRLVGCDLAQDDASVAGRHVQINQEGVIWRLRNPGSISGSSVNDKMTTDATLIDGDKIRIGSLEFIFQSLGTEPRPPKRTVITRVKNNKALLGVLFSLLVILLLLLIFYR